MSKTQLSRIVTVKRVLAFWALMLAMCLQTARAELNIEITQGRDNAVSIATVPFLWEGSKPLPQDIAKIVGDDLSRSGQFVAFDRQNMLAFPATPKEVVYSDWSRQKVEYLLIGKIKQDGAKYKAHFELFDVVRQKPLLSSNVSGTQKQLRAMAHFISDKVYQKVTGVRGDFSTKIMYVTSVFHKPGDIDYALNYADSDGHNPIKIVRSKSPIMSPAWSPDGKQVAYVSFESKRSAIYVQNLATGERQQLTKFKGLNSAPAWSPDGKKMAMVLSLSGTPEIYVMDLATRKLTQITNHYSINTSPSWMPDGKAITFTSSRSGGPQIFKVDLADHKVSRLTFDGRYNARAKIFDNGNAMVMVQKGEGRAAFHIAVQNLKNGRVHVLTPQTRLDDAPSVSPNGTMVIYATRPEGSERELAMVSVDGRFRIRIPSSDGSVSEPAWSPYLN